MKEYQIDVFKGELCYYRLNEKGIKSRPITQVDGKLVYITPQLIMRKQRIIDRQNAVSPPSSPKSVWLPFWSEELL